MIHGIKIMSLVWIWYETLVKVG